MSNKDIRIEFETTFSNLMEVTGVKLKKTNPLAKHLDRIEKEDVNERLVAATYINRKLWELRDMNGKQYNKEYQAAHKALYDFVVACGGV